MDNKETGIAIINMVLMKYNLYPFVSEFCDKIEIIESDDFYGNIMQYIEIESQKENVILCKRQFEYIDATVIMPQKINRTAYILLKTDLTLESSIRKTIHELIHLVHRCIITKKLMLSDLYEIEEHCDYKLFYYLDEFLTKKKELIIYYDLLHNELFTIAETMAYINIFPGMFPEHFIEKHSSMSDISDIMKILSSIEHIDFFITNKEELKNVINLIENNLYTSHQ